MQPSTGQTSATQSYIGQPVGIRALIDMIIKVVKEVREVKVDKIISIIITKEVVGRQNCQRYHPFHPWYQHLPHSLTFQ